MSNNYRELTGREKLAVSRPQQGFVSIGRNSNRCNAFALGKPCAARLF